MTANELRIGNLVNGVLTQEPYIIDAWALREMENGNYQNSYDTETKVFEPIPLTEEWLVKFGFKITKQTKEDNNIWTVYGEESKFELEEIIGFFLYDNMCFGTQTKYVHSLQNLYFALTGEELTFKSE